jgi:isoamylase
MVGRAVRLSREFTARRSLLRSPRQRARHAEGVVTDDSFNWADDRPPNVPWSDTVIYEAHVRGLSMLRHDLRPTSAAPSRRSPIRGHRPSAAARRHGRRAAADPRLRAGPHLLEKGLRNYWGYNTLGFFAPEPRYLSDNTRDEMRIAVRRLHAAGIEVILDVVYNHTAEGSEMGPTLSFRGLDNASYYRLADNPRHCINDTGTGNTLNLSHPRVLQMVMDSLRYWVTPSCRRLPLRSRHHARPRAHGFDPGSRASSTRCARIPCCRASS